MTSGIFLSKKNKFRWWDNHYIERTISMWTLKILYRKNVNWIKNLYILKKLQRLIKKGGWKNDKKPRIHWKNGGTIRENREATSECEDKADDLIVHKIFGEIKVTTIADSMLVIDCPDIGQKRLVKNKNCKFIKEGEKWIDI